MNTFLYGQVYAWEPEVYTDNSSLPTKDKKNFKEGYMTVTCEGEVCMAIFLNLICWVIPYTHLPHLFNAHCIH